MLKPTDPKFLTGLMYCMNREYKRYYTDTLMEVELRLLAQGALQFLLDNQLDQLPTDLDVSTIGGYPRPDLQLQQTARGDKVRPRFGQPAIPASTPRESRRRISTAPKIDPEETISRICSHNYDEFDVCIHCGTDYETAEKVRIAWEKLRDKQKQQVDEWVEEVLESEKTLGQSQNPFIDKKPAPKMRIKLRK